MAMYCKWSERVYGNEDIRDCYIISEGAPNSISGADIDNLADSAKVSIGSLCVDGETGKKYIVGIDEEWHECSAGGGGGYPEPSGTLQVTSNGLVNVKDWAQANVNVSANGLGIHDIRFVHGVPEAYSVTGFFSDLTSDARSLVENEIKFHLIVAGENDFTASIDYDGSNTDLGEIANTYNSLRSFVTFVNGSYSQDMSVGLYLPWNMTRFSDSLLPGTFTSLKTLYIRGDASMYSNCVMDGNVWSNTYITDVYVPWAESDRDISTEAWFLAIGQYAGTPATAHYNATYDQTTGELITV